MVFPPEEASSAIKFPGRKVSMKQLILGGETMKHFHQLLLFKRTGNMNPVVVGPEGISARRWVEGAVTWREQTGKEAGAANLLSV